MDNTMQQPQFNMNNAQPNIVIQQFKSVTAHTSTTARFEAIKKG